jgi:hypothetical protein
MAAMTFDAYLTNMLLCANPAARLALANEGLVDFHSFSHLTETSIKDICYNCKRPGGVATPAPVVVPVAGGPGRGGAGRGRGGGRGAGAIVPAVPIVPAAAPVNNPGVAIGFLIQHNLTAFAYFWNYCERVQLTFSAVDATLALLLSHFQLKELEESKDDAFDPPSKLTKFAETRDVHEVLNDYFSRKMGAVGSPLAYMNRNIVTVAPLVASIATVGFPSYSEQMIARTRHDIPGFASDCATVWGIMRSVTYGGPGWAWVSAFQRANDGRAAKLAFSVHYRCDAHTSRIRSEAVRKLQVTFFDGKTRFTMEQYLTVLASCFTDLFTFGQPYTEVMKMDVLRRTLPAESFKPAMLSIALTATLRDNFDLSCVFLLEADNLPRQHTLHKPSSNCQVSSTSHGRGGRGGCDGGHGGRDGHGRGRGLVRATVVAVDLVTAPRSSIQTMSLTRIMTILNGMC